MSRTLRISVPIPSRIHNEIRHLCAQNGRSAASNLADLIVAGLQKNDLDARFAELKSALKSPSSGPVNHAEIVAEINKSLATFLAEMQQKVPAGDTAAHGEVVFLPEKAAALLFEEAFFAAKLSAEIMSVLPGSQPKPGGQHIATARKNAKAAMAELIKLCQEPT